MKNYLNEGINKMFNDEMGRDVYRSIGALYFEFGQAIVMNRPDVIQTVLYLNEVDHIPGDYIFMVFNTKKHDIEVIDVTKMDLMHGSAAMLSMVDKYKTIIDVEAMADYYEKMEFEDIPFITPEEQKEIDEFLKENK